ncbi:hypothetical protein ZWY2020_003600 [Hordeum vulgare]|nr:hypothetical protein ZWY2020_003600 [Hordeum vulgare]
MTKGQTSKMEARKKKGKAAAAQRRQRPLPPDGSVETFSPPRTEGTAGAGFQKKNRSIYPALQLSESVRNWQSTWFYCQDIACSNASTGLPPFSLDRPAPPKQLALSKAEKKDIQPLVEAFADVVRRGVTGMDLLEVFIGRRIQPLQARHHAMWHYAGPEDSTRTNVEGILEEKVTSKAWTNWFSPVSSGKLEEEDEEGSQEGSVESDEYIFDSGESEEENSEEEEKDEEPDSPPPRPEHRSRRRKESAVPSVPFVLPSVPPASPAAPSVRGIKRTRDATAEPAGQSSKAPKSSGSKPRKALPRMRVAIPVTSTIATSATSPARQGDDPMDADNVVSSQPGGRADPIAEPVEEPVPEAAPPAAALAADALPNGASPAERR